MTAGEIIDGFAELGSRWREIVLMTCTELHRVLGKTETQDATTPAPVSADDLKYATNSQEAGRQAYEQAVAKPAKYDKEAVPEKSPFVAREETMRRQNKSINEVSASLNQAGTNMPEILMPPNVRPSDAWAKLHDGNQAQLPRAEYVPPVAYTDDDLAF